MTTFIEGYFVGMIAGAAIVIIIKWLLKSTKEDTKIKCRR